jgi:peptide subunit release factor 1 (eRF1)
MYNDTDTNGIIYTDGNECIWYELKNNNIKKLADKKIYLQNQFKNGGQSSNRIARNRDIQRDQYIQLLAEKSIELFYNKSENMQTVKNILFCGPAEFKIELANNKNIIGFLSNIHIVTMGDLDLDLINKVINNISDPQELINIKKINDMIAMADNKLVFGSDIIEMVNTFQLDILFVHNDMYDSDKINDFKKYNEKLNIIKIKSDMINQYGGMIGVKFY